MKASDLPIKLLCGIALLTMLCAPTKILGAVVIDPFTAPGEVSYYFYNSYHAAGQGAAGSINDFGTVSGGTWSPQSGGRNTDYFVVNNASICLLDIGDSVSLDFYFSSSFSSGNQSAIGIILSNSLAPSTTQTEIMVQHSFGSATGPSYFNLTGSASTIVTQTGFSTLSIVKTAYDLGTDTSTYQATVSGGGLSLSKTYTKVGNTAYIGLGIFAAPSNGVVGAVGENFILTAIPEPSSVALIMAGCFLAGFVIFRNRRATSFAL